MKQFIKCLFLIPIFGLFQSPIVKAQDNSELSAKKGCIHYAIENENLVNHGYYDSNQLLANKVSEKNGTIIYEFYDQANRLVVKREIIKTTPMDTYFVYDERGNTRYVLPTCVSGSEITEDRLRDYAFSYVYDDYNYLIAKKLPLAHRSVSGMGFVPRCSP
jgi:hypothetical protein